MVEKTAWRIGRRLASTTGERSDVTKAEMMAVTMGWKLKLIWMLSVLTV